MYQIDVQAEVEGTSVPTERLITAIGHVLDTHDVSRDSALTVVIAADEYVGDLNKQFRGVDAPTDVLSFPADAPPPQPDWIDAEDEEPPYLGDLIIAYPYTVRQANELGHALDDELTLLVIHGTLHLLGYDHDTPENQDEMWAAQAEALAHANVPIAVPRFTFIDSDTSPNDTQT
ncbi:MAG: rRNA maturation RNase YbeY [Aggregatilineales bacterium]